MPHYENLKIIRIITTVSTNKTAYKLKAVSWEQNMLQCVLTGIFEVKFIYPQVNSMTRLHLQFFDGIFIIWTPTLD